MDDFSGQALQETTEVLAGLRQYLLEVRRRAGPDPDPMVLKAAWDIGELLHELNKRGFMELGSEAAPVPLSVVS